MGKLTIVSSLMLGTALSQCFGLEKTYNFTGGWQCCMVSVVQLLSFLILMRVVFVCFMSLYAMCQQLYHIYRLMTSGPTGVELAGEYYLHPNITVWRHTAVNRLLKSFGFFIVALGLILSVKIMKDGGTIKACYKHAEKGPEEPTAVEIVYAILHNITLTTLMPEVPGKTGTHLDWFQPIFAAFVLFCFLLCAWVLNHIHATHSRVFDDVYRKCRELLPSTRVWNTQMQQDTSGGYGW